MRREEGALEPTLRRLLAELSEKLGEAIADAPEVGEKIEAVREAGYTVHLLLDCKRTSDESADGDTSTTVGTERQLPAPPAGVFRVDARDVAFLRSVGIDPTRSCRSQR